MRAYALHRPLGPFTYPSEYRDAITEIHNFDHMEFVPDIRRYAFGYIEFADGSIPKEALDRYELATDPRLDPHWVATGKELAEAVKAENWGRFERVWDIAQAKYGLSDDEIEQAMSWYEKEMSDSD